MGGTLRAEEVEPLLRGAYGRPYVWADECRSTQELAHPLPHGGAAACEAQSAGRGRLGRRWAAPHGRGVLFSVAIDPAVAVDRLAPISLVAAEAICTVTLPGAQVRWPNDVVIEGRKLAGVLVEVRGGRAVIGIGVNANLRERDLPAEARVPATSLLVETGREVDRPALLAELLWSLEQHVARFQRDGFGGLARDELRGRQVTLAGGTSGHCDGTDPDGRLVVAGIAHTSAEVTSVEVA
jgi:BirA family transcriptional regulator, biotin operon repressor / biotin---[acetyl-CoA-carboxylase] ligase